MKHPRFRCRDILFLDPQVRDEVYDFVRSLQPLLHPFIRENMVRFEHVGSMVFGNNKLRSDWDFNIAMPDWNSQIEARRIYSGNLGKWRVPLSDALVGFYRETGLQIDLGCVDPDTVKYNICVTLDDMLLHHRDTIPQEEFTLTDSGIVWEKESAPTSLLTFDPLKDSAPTAHNIHLKWNFMLNRWQRIPLDTAPADVSYMRVKQEAARWAKSEERWPDDVAFWQKRYGDRFQSYHEENGILIQD